ncbi:uncharacterized protein LOC113129507 [Mastacembelus armatus]|uniref:uncharacterized protein LOC113129507 n=1 Tax=Mastacembelus armatus TaxID=205130 RepID=UPI000E4573CF|nr:uncharacterized protein LOC113129507 [Mastacembelus armatus]
MSAPSSPCGAGAAASCQPSSSVDSSDFVEHDLDQALLLPVTRSSLLARRLLRFRACSGHVSPVTRRKREMTPADKKDSAYWDKRRKNNEAAKRSREKRRMNDLMLERQLLTLSEENAQLRARVLSLQYHSSRSAEKSKAASGWATSRASVVASTLASPRLAHTPALIQAELWGKSRNNPASVLGMGQQETVSHPFEAKMPCFSSTAGAGDFNHLCPENCGTQQGIFPLSGHRVLSPRAALEGGRSMEVEADAQRQVSSSDDIFISTDELSDPGSSVRAFLPTPDTLHHTSTLTHPAQSWLVPHMSHPVCNNLLVPWRSPYLSPSAVYHGLPLYIQERQGPGLGVEADFQRGFMSRFSNVPPGLSQLGMP